MKKVLKFGVILTALVFGLVCLAACSDGGGSNDGGGSVNNNGGGITNNSGGNSNNGNTNNDEEVDVKPTLLAYWKAEGGGCSYKFYSDETYEFLEKTAVTGKGNYYGNPRQKGYLSIYQKYKYDDNATKLVTTNNEYTLYIDKDDDGDLYFSDAWWSYTLVN